MKECKLKKMDFFRLDLELYTLAAVVSEDGKGIHNFGEVFEMVTVACDTSPLCGGGKRFARSEKSWRLMSATVPPPPPRVRG